MDTATRCLTPLDSRIRNSESRSTSRPSQGRRH
ncbi:hypothetical protein AZE42_03082, partial [Rhizopogon vesiculosus]